MEVINDLVGFKGLKIVQNTEWFNFSLDSILLANFVTLNTTTKRIIDFGTGNAPIPLVLTTRTKADIYAVEIQKDIYNLAKETLKINNLQEKITLLNDDIKKISNHFESDYFDVITCNPPFFKVDSNSKLTTNIVKRNARHEVLLNLDDIFKTAKKILKTNGVISLVHRPERLFEIAEKMKEYGFSVKRVQLVYSSVNKNANILLIEGKKNNKGGTIILPPLYVHNEDGSYTKEIKTLFEAGDLNETEKL